MNTLRAFITALLLTNSIGPSWAGTSTITTKDASGATKTFDVVTDGSGNFNGTAVVCDGTAAANCAAVKAASTAAGATDPALVVAVSPNNSVAVTAASLPLPTGAATAANQATNAATTAHTCSVAGYSELGCLGQIDDDVKGSISAGTNIIGKVGIDQTSDVTTNGVEIAPTAAAAAAITAVISGAAESNHVLKASAGNLYNAYATSTVAGYLLIFNATSAPADGAVTPQNCIPGALTQSGIYAASINYNPGPVEIFTTGITASWSSTGCFTKTASATAFIHGLVK